MTYGIWLSAAGLQVNAYRQSLMANNLANVDTAGFKHDLALMTERRVESRRGPAMTTDRHGLLDGLSGGTQVQPTYHAFDQGTLLATGNPQDVALFGDGFLTVRDGDQVRYTRDGRFTFNDAGELVMVAGGGRIKVLDQAGTPIVRGATADGAVNIADDGTVRQGDNVIGKLAIVDFEDRQMLRKRGANLFENTGTPQRPADAVLRGGFVERSTVNPVNGLAKMIEITRLFELNARMISLQDQTLGQAVNTVGRLG